VKISDAVFSAGSGGFFFDDQAAVKSGLARDGFDYVGDPVTPGFDRVRVPAEAVSVTLVLEDGTTAVGDCCAVQYSGAGGRDPLFRAAEHIEWMSEHLAPLLVGRDVSAFRANAEEIDALTDGHGRAVHTAIRYGVTQALLAATAAGRRLTVPEVVCDEYGLELVAAPLRIYAQTGDDRYANAEKMILKGVDVLPHGLINNVLEKLGAKGETLLEYVTWLRGRILELRGDESYEPELHIDVYGTVGMAFDHDLGRIVDYLAELEKAAAPFRLRVEAPVDMGSRQRHLEAMCEIVRAVEAKGLTVETVADEWCDTLEDIELFAREKAAHMLQIKTPDLGGINNTIEAALICRRHGVKPFQGGSCTETDISARICTAVAVATRPYQVLAKPGMGFDEGYVTVRNEMERTVAALRAKGVGA